MHCSDGVTLNSHQRMLSMCHCNLGLEVINAASPLPCATAQHGGRAGKKRSGRSGPPSRTCWHVKAQIAGRSIICCHRDAAANLRNSQYRHGTCAQYAHTDSCAADREGKLRTEEALQKRYLMQQMIATTGEHAYRRHCQKKRREVHVAAAAGHGSKQST